MKHQRSGVDNLKKADNIISSHPQMGPRGSLAPPRLRPRGFFYAFSSESGFVSVDGFNLYHSLVEAANDLKASTKWLDLRSLCEAYLSVLGPDAILESIYYFSALAKHIDARRPGTTLRHRNYVQCLQSTGVIAELGRFKYKTVRCPSCQTNNPHYEEKETDVAISVRMLELFFTDKADTVVLLSGDTDLAPAVRTAKNLFPAKEICFAFPYKRKNSELAKMVENHFKIRSKQLLKYQLLDTVVLPTGRKIDKPRQW